MQALESWVAFVSFNIKQMNTIHTPRWFGWLTIYSLQMKPLTLLVGEIATAIQFNILDEWKWFWIESEITSIELLEEKLVLFWPFNWIFWGVDSGCECLTVLRKPLFSSRNLCMGITRYFQNSTKSSWEFLKKMWSR